MLIQWSFSGATPVARQVYRLQTLNLRVPYPKIWKQQIGDRVHMKYGDMALTYGNPTKSAEMFIEYACSYCVYANCMRLYAWYKKVG